MNLQVKRISKFSKISRKNLSRILPRKPLMRFLQVKRIPNFSEISSKNLSRIIPKKPRMRFREVLLPAK